MLLTYYYIIYYFFLTAIMAGTRVYSFIVIPVPISVTAFPSKLTFSFTFMSITALNQYHLPSSSCFSSILLMPGPYITKISLTKSIFTSLVSMRTYIMVLQILFPAGILMLILLAVILFFLQATLVVPTLLTNITKILQLQFTVIAVQPCLLLLQPICSGMKLYISFYLVKPPITALIQLPVSFI